MSSEEFLAQIYCRNSGIDIFPLHSGEGAYTIIIEDRRDMSLTFSPKTYQKLEAELKVHELEIYYYRKSVVSN